MADVPIPFPRRALAVAVLLGAALLASSCGAGGGGGTIAPGDKVGPCISGGGPPVTINGIINYVRLVLGGGGLGPATETRPCRYVDVEVRGAGGGLCYGRGSTDGTGNYSVVANPPAGTPVEVAVFSRTLENPSRDILVHEADPPGFNVHNETDVFSHASSPFIAAATTVNLTVPYTGGPANRPSIGFGALDTIVTCRDVAAGALGGPLPQIHIYTRLGNNAALFGTSFYSHSAQAVALLGGAAGSPDSTDTDYFDDAVVSHEFHHFVDKSVGHSMSRGGAHQGDPLEPNFAWSEGLATGFGNLALGTPFYIDTTTTVGNILFVLNVENQIAFDNNGIGDEFSMAEIIWDLGDGGEGPADTDADGLTASFSHLYGALDSFSPATDAPYIGLFLDRVVALSPLTTGQITAFLNGPPENQMIAYPTTGTPDDWPIDIGIGGNDSGVVDSLVANPCRGLAASAWYRLVLPSSVSVTIQLTMSPIVGSGDCNLFLTRNEDVNLTLASSTNAGTTPESIVTTIGPGTYIVRVEAECFTGTRANYTLTIN